MKGQSLHVCVSLSCHAMSSAFICLLVAAVPSAWQPHIDQCVSISTYPSVMPMVHSIRALKLSHMHPLASNKVANQNRNHRAGWVVAVLGDVREESCLGSMVLSQQLVWPCLHNTNATSMMHARNPLRHCTWHIRPNDSSSCAGTALATAVTYHLRLCLVCSLPARTHPVAHVKTQRALHPASCPF